MRISDWSSDVCSSDLGAQTRWEPEPVTVSLGGVSVPFPPFAFLQATADGEAALVEAAQAVTASAGTIADLFSGLGTFALSVGRGKAVYAAEAARDLVLSLKSAANRAQRKLVVVHRDLFRRSEERRVGKECVGT